MKKQRMVTFSRANDSGSPIGECVHCPGKGKKGAGESGKLDGGPLLIGASKSGGSERPKQSKATTANSGLS